MIERDVGNGFVAVPYDSVTLNGHPLAVLNVATEPYSGPWAMIAPRGKAVDSEFGTYPHRYKTIEECVDDAKTLAEIGCCSVCP